MERVAGIGALRADLKVRAPGRPFALLSRQRVLILPSVGAKLYSIPATTERKKMERVAGIEPASEAWEASILPLNYTRLKFGE